MARNVFGEGTDDKITEDYHIPPTAQGILQVLWQRDVTMNAENSLGPHLPDLGPVGPVRNTNAPSHRHARPNQVRVCPAWLSFRLFSADTQQPKEQKEEHSAAGHSTCLHRHPLVTS